MPYISPKPRQPQSPATETEAAQPTASAITPTFTHFQLDPVSKASTYSPQDQTGSRRTVDGRQAESSPVVVAERDDAVPQSSPTRATSPTFPPAVNKRASWSKRKPVPPNIVLPNTISPYDYPSTRGLTPARTLPLDTVPSPAVSVRSGPVPPRRPNNGRSTSSLHTSTPRSPAGSDMTEKSGLFSQTPTLEGGKDDRHFERVETLLPGSGSMRSFQGAEKSLQTPKPIPSRRSSKRLAFELGKPLTSSAEATGSSNHHDTAGEMPPMTNNDRHPLRARVDKSLPSLPLEEDNMTIRGDRYRLQHRHMDSTSTAQSTHLVTPRSDSYSFTRQLGVPDEEEERAQEKRKLKWLRDMSRPKKDKGTNGAEQTEGSINTPRDIAVDAGEALDEPEEDETFSVDRLPSKRRLWEAGTLFLRDEDGELVCFGDMFPKVPDAAQPGEPAPPVPRTVVFFIRSFWCGQCQDYMFASLSQLDPEAVEKAGIRVIVVGTGSWKIIKSYRKLFKCPFPIYVDGPRKLYSLLGMTKLSYDFGPMSKGRAAYHQSAVPKQILLGGKNALIKMPLANPGNTRQLGGEFVLSPGYNCDFAHRMTTRSDHMEAPDVLREAGCLYPTKSETHEITIEENQRAEIERLELEMQNWRQEREAELERIRRKKAERRGMAYVPMSHANVSEVDLGTDAALDATDALPIESVTATGNGTVPVGDDLEAQANRAKMDKLFQEAMTLQGLDQEGDRQAKRKSVATFGRKASGIPNGQEIGVVTQ